jgi:hypothetical protein
MTALVGEGYDPFAEASGIAREEAERHLCWGNTWGNSPHGSQTILNELDPAETALESPPRCPDAPPARAHNPWTGGW